MVLLFPPLQITKSQLCRLTHETVRGIQSTVDRGLDPWVVRIFQQAVEAVHAPEAFWIFSNFQEHLERLRIFALRQSLSRPELEFFILILQEAAQFLSRFFLLKASQRPNSASPELCGSSQFYYRFQGLVGANFRSKIGQDPRRMLIHCFA